MIEKNGRMKLPGANGSQKKFQMVMHGNILGRNIHRMKIKNYYDKVASEEKLFKFFRRRIRKLTPAKIRILNFVKEVNPRKILDAGCGVSTDLGFYKENNINAIYFGVDTCIKFVENGMKKYPGNNFCTASVEALPFKNQAFDVVTCRAVLEHVKNIDTALSELLRVSNKFVLIEWKKPPRTKEKITFNRKKNYYSNWYSDERIKNIIAKSYHEIIKIEKIDNHEIWIAEQKNTH
jgi:ubiquinone/menaquinone biosynthesis C-methylase UbiE